MDATTKARKEGQEICNKGTADTAGEKPRASGGVHKMTTAEIRAALVVEEVE